MLRTSSPLEQNYRRASAAVFLLGVVSAWIAVWCLRPYPTIYALPKGDGLGFTPVLVGALVLFPVAFPIAASIFNPSKVVFALATALSLPLFFVAGRDLGNVYFDSSEAKTVIVTITAKRESSGWKTHDYFLQVVPKGESRVQEFAVSYSYYQACTAGQLVAVKVHPGFLGKGWVSSYGNHQEI